jgi:hypothetical protein
VQLERKRGIPRNPLINAGALVVCDGLLLVEGIVGVMSGVAQMPVDQAFDKLCWFRETQGQELPEWCTREFVAEVAELMRRLMGRWKATPYSETMEIDWVED